MSEISIIIRTYNEEKWIGQCLRGISQQTLENISDIEVILVDNLSEDKTVEKAKCVYPELTLVSIDDYMPGLALNKGIEASSGEFFVCLSAHCIPVHEQWLEALHRDFSSNDNVAGVYGRQVPTESSDPVDKRDLIRTFGPEQRVQTKDTFFHNANSMIRRKVWEEYPFHEEVTNIEDQIWGNEVINAGYKLIYEPDAPVYHYHGINQGNDESRVQGVVRTMEEHQIHPDESDIKKFNGCPLDPEKADIIAFVPIQQQTKSGVDFDERLIKRTINTVNEATYIDDVILLTDSEYVAGRAEEWGSQAPFLRPLELSERDTEVTEVFSFGIKTLEDNGRFPDLVVPLEITHPFRPSDMLDNMITKLLGSGNDTVVAAFPEYRPCWTGANDELNRINEDTTFRVERNPIQIGLPGLGCVTYPEHLRESKRIGDEVGLYCINDSLATVEIRNRKDLNDWELLRDLHRQ
jgi:CMP-N-acetylneuraminic acid synthetase